MELNKIYNGDCYELIKQIPDKSIDLIITDPPYEFGTGGISTGIFKNRKSAGTYQEIHDTDLGSGIDLSILNEYVRVLKKINIYIWCNKEQIYDYLTFFVKERNCNWEMLVWAKSNPAPFVGGHYLKDKEYCLFFREKGVKLNGDYHSLKTCFFTNTNTEDKEKYGHPTIKPLDLIKQLIKNSSERGGVVLDTFVGSGTTCVGAKELDRQFIGFELNEKYYKIAVDRLNGIDKNGQTDLFNTDYEQLELF